MNKNTLTASLIILLSLSVMATAVLSYYYILSIRSLGEARADWIAIQQKQARVNYLIRDASYYSRTNAEIIPLLESFDVFVRPGVGTNEVVNPREETE